MAAPLIICNDEHRFLVAEQLRQIGIRRTLVLEPIGRNTAPAVAAAAVALSKDEPDGAMLVLPSDHAIQDTAAFHRAIRTAALAAGKGRLATFGIIPNAPETGYGYIRRAEALPGLDNTFAISRFVEKPDLETARGFLATGDYFWNSGMFLMKASTYLEELAAFQPAILAAVRKALDASKMDMDFCRLDEKAFAESPSISIDYAVMEKTKLGAVVPVEMGWNDVGSWDALWDLHEKTAAGNVLQGDVLASDVSNTFIKAENRMVAAVGVDDLVIVETADAVLVSSRKSAQDVKLLVDRLKSAERTEHVTHRASIGPGARTRASTPARATR